MISVLRATLFALLFVICSSTNADEIQDYDWPDFEEIEAQARESESTKYLAKLFGTWVYGTGIEDVVMGEEQGARTPLSVFGNAIAGAGVTLFSLLAGYVVLVGLIRTAQTGEFGGRDWDMTWVLGRMLGTVIMIAPLNGMPAGQHLVIAVAKYSSATADIVWARTLRAIGHERTRVDQTFNAQLSVDDGMRLVGRAIAHGACLEAKYNENSVVWQQEGVSQADIDRMIARFGLDCGMDLEAIGAQASGAFSSEVKAKESLDWTWAPEAERRNARMRAAAMAVAKRYYTQAFNLGRKLAGDNVQAADVAYTAVQLASGFVRDFKKETNAAMAKDAQSNIDAFAREAQRAGWVEAGVLYRQLAAQQTAIANAMSDAAGFGGESISPEERFPTPGVDDMAFAATNKAYRVWEEGALGGLLNATSAADDTRASDQAKAAHALGDVTEFFGLNILRAGNSADPITVATAWGRALGTVAQADMFAQLNPVYKIATKIADEVTEGKISLLRNILFGAAMFLTVVVPALPWVYMLLAVISWLTHVAEMYICAPLWIAAHAAPEGRDHTSNLAAKGYNNFLFVTLFPILAIGGLIAAMAVSWVGISLLNHSLAGQFVSELGGYSGAWALITRGLPTLLGFILLYCALLWMVLTTSFNLVQAFPRTILDWLSTAPAGASAFQQAAEHAGGMAIGVYNRGGGHSAGHMVGGPKAHKAIGQQPKQHKGS